MVALESAMDEDPVARYATLNEKALRIAGALGGIAGIETWVLPDGRQGQPCPRAVVRLQPSSGWTRVALMAALAAGDPAVLVGDLDEDADAFYVNPLSLTEQDELVVIQRVRELVTDKP